MSGLFFALLSLHTFFFHNQTAKLRWVWVLWKVLRKFKITRNKKEIDVICYFALHSTGGNSNEWLSRFPSSPNVHDILKGLASVSRALVSASAIRSTGPATLCGVLVWCSNTLVYQWINQENISCAHLRRGSAAVVLFTRSLRSLFPSSSRTQSSLRRIVFTWCWWCVCVLTPMLFYFRCEPIVEIAVRSVSFVPIKACRRRSSALDEYTQIHHRRARSLKHTYTYEYTHERIQTRAPHKWVQP